MSTKSAPIVSLQPPKDVSLSDIETELSQIWQSYGMAGDNAGLPPATRATTFSLIVYEPEETQQLLAALGVYKGPIDGIPGPQTEAALRELQKKYGVSVTGTGTPETLQKLREEVAKRGGNESINDGVSNGSIDLAYSLSNQNPKIADAIALRNPCRIVALCPMAGEDVGVKVQVSAYCPLQKQASNTLICCEYITLKGTAAALERVGGLVSALLIGDLPKFLWWKATPDPSIELFKRLASACNSVIFDSSNFTETEANLVKLQELLKAGTPLADLNWRRLSAWQELTAEAFDAPERRLALREVDRVTVDYEKGNPAQALMYLGWLASRLNWHPTEFQEESGDYDFKRIHFVADDQRLVEAELAGVPITDVGQIPGDLIALRLTSTNVEADCCTVLCSETSGCMRMESGGGAQSCRFQQVSSLADQKAEILLSEQLQRWGSDPLYEESLAIAAEILALGKY